MPEYEFSRPLKLPAKREIAQDVWSDQDLSLWIERWKPATWVVEWIQSLRGVFADKTAHFWQKGLGSQNKCPTWMSPKAKKPEWLLHFLTHTSHRELWFTHGFLAEDPPWIAKLIQLEAAKVARAFFITGNTSDYAFDPHVGYRPAMRLLVDSLKEIKDCVLTIRLSTGLTLESRASEIDRSHLPKNLQMALDNSKWLTSGNIGLSICQLFDTINNWLQPDCANPENSHHFPNGIAIVFENIHLMIPEDSHDWERGYLIDHLLRWSNSPSLFRGPHCFILISDSLESVSRDLRMRGGKIEEIHIQRPDTTLARLKFMLPLLDPGSNMTETRVTDLLGNIARLEGYGNSHPERLSRFANDTAGLNFIGIEDLLQQASLMPQATLDRDSVMRIKRERLRQESEGLLDVIDPTVQLDDIGGYEEIKSRLAQVTKGLRNTSDPLTRQTLPMGILFVGPPGTGKSLMAAALAKESGVSMAKLGDFRGMYVGQSEHNLSRIFNLIEALHPVIVFIDEIDQAIGKRGISGGDGGVDNRLFGKFLEFMSNPDHLGKILWVGASNVPENIDAAFKRAGRFDVILPFLRPNLSSRISILDVQLQQLRRKIPGLSIELDEKESLSLSHRMDGFTGAEIEGIVKEVIRRLSAERNNDSKTPLRLTYRNFEIILAVFQPPEKQKADYLRMELAAIQEITFRDLIPKDALALVQRKNEQE